MSSAYARLVIVGEPCEMDASCKNSLSNCVRQSARCSECQWCPEEPGGGKDYFKPIDSRVRFTRRENAERDTRRAKTVAKREKHQDRDKGRVRVNRAAARAERATERAIIKSTVNSGRAHNDGDHISAGSIVLDTKMQSARLHPVVKLEELAKVRSQARAAGYPIGALVLRNKDGLGIVAMAEEDFALLVRAHE